jgi:uncharacterized protein (TIGR02145 family)
LENTGKTKMNMRRIFITLLIVQIIIALPTLSFSQDWLYYPTGIPKNYIDVGTLNVSGSAITVEALITPTDLSLATPKDIVSKHTDFIDCNYLLRYMLFAVTTSSGYSSVTNPIIFCVDSTYHVAGTYDGDSIKYFVNGNRVAAVHWTGTLVQNTHDAALGNISLVGYDEQLYGYMDEVRIWNVARSQTDLSANMYNLPNPTTQPGLLAYYKFEGNYTNLQGNATYNGVPVGAQVQETTDPYFQGVVSGPQATVSVSIAASNNNVCSGTPVVFTAFPVHGGTAPSYQWKVNGLNVGSNSQTYTYNPVNGDIVICVLTSNLGCTINNQATSNSIVMVVTNSTFPVSVSIVSSSNPSCQGDLVNFTATPNNEGSSPIYEWKVNGTDVGTNSPVYSYIPTNGDIVVCVLHSSLSCVTGNPATSNSIVANVVANSQVSVSISASSTNICSGDQVTFTASPISGGPIPFYQWQVNGANSGTNSPLFTYTPVNNDVVTCILHSNLNCTTGNPATSNSVVITVNQSTAVSISISASSTSVCSGSSVTFTATPAGVGMSPTYQWKLNGNNTGTNSSTYTYIPSNNDVVTCILNSDLSCTSGNPATSNSIVITVVSNTQVSVSISSSSTNICSGDQVTLTASPVSGGTTPSYQWQVNGVNFGTNSPLFTYTPVNNDVVTCILTSDLNCVSGNPATSNSVVITVNQPTTVSISISASATSVCSGTSVTFTATPAGVGTTPTYQWKVNGNNAGGNSSTYVYTPTNNDVVTCILTSDLSCTSGNPATSNPVTITVNPNLPVSISITASAYTVCAGTSVTFNATPTYPGTLPTYQWKVNGNNVGTNSSSYTYIPISGDLTTCTLNSNETCTSGNPAVSNTISITVNPNLTPAISIAASNNPVCQGSTVTFTATPVHGGTLPAFQWMVNGLNAGTNSPLYSYVPLNNDAISCQLTSNLTCIMGNPATSNTILMTINNNPFVTFTPCFDTITMTTAKPIQLKGGIPLGGTYSGPGVNSSTGIFTPALAGAGVKTINYSYTNSSLCSVSASIPIHILALAAFNCGNNLTDIRDNKVYPTIQIGGQCWFDANLNYGSQIPVASYQRDNCVAEKYCYNDSPLQCSNGAVLYQWDELMQYDLSVSVKGLCPPAWHVPNENEWNLLFSNWINNAFAGSPLKYSGYSGFDAILSGVGVANQAWRFGTFATFLWSSTAFDSTKAWAHAMNDIDPSVALYPALRSDALSVRCIHD